MLVFSRQLNWGTFSSFFLFLFHSGTKAHQVGTGSFTAYNRVTHKKMSQREESERGRQRAWNWGNSIPSALSKWWMCYDGPAPAHKHVTYSKTKETSFHCPCLGIFHKYIHISLCLSLFLCFILCLTANDRWRLCRSSKVIEDHSSFFTTEESCLLLTHFFSACLSFVPMYILNVQNIFTNSDVSVKRDRLPQNCNSGIIN